MFCPNCGKEVSDTSLFCTNCGHALNSNAAQNNTAENYAEPNYNNVEPNYDNAMPNYNNAAPNYNNAMPNYNNVEPNYATQNYTAPNYNNAAQYNYNNSRKTPSIIGAIAAIAALVGCFLPFISNKSYGISIEFSFMDVKKVFDAFNSIPRYGYNVPIEYQIILNSPIIFIAACVIAIICSLIGVKVFSRLAGLVNVAVLILIFFSSANGSTLAQYISSAGPGIGLILMIIGSVGMLISP